ncbi:MAG TPA: aminotransferase class I/II-fold pyridoxal phosphate-dependent enzyme [Polyangiales bacterium]|nr:aminotransferase class I/II-fold pyridoxal phosphate-dependent enzyme [Polyangiales bacterium]
MTADAYHPLAQQLNQTLEKASPEVFAMLSALGKRLYFPKGILAQGAEAKAKGKRFNATIGIATENDAPMFLPSIHQSISGLSVDEAYNYAPPSGRQKLREIWREKNLAENPSLKGKTFGLPIVTSAITHGLTLVGDLFVDPGDVMIAPDQLWDNYSLTYETRQGAKIETFPLFSGKGFNVEGFANALRTHGAKHGKLLVMLNFPNNPTGYMPTADEGKRIVAALHEQAKAGTRLVVLCDDAYFGLFYHLGGESLTESLFGQLCNLHPKLLPIKLDGATKELFVWGLRCGFVTFGLGSTENAQQVLEVLDAKARASIRSAISNSPMISQSLVEKALASSEIATERKQKLDVLRQRAEAVYKVSHEARFASSWDVYPFNSGYFMLIKVKGVDANKLREHLLDKHGTGLICTSPTDLRVAFSCLDVTQVEPLFETIHRAVQELRG